MPKPVCELCGSTGEVAESGISDPDRSLDGTWSFQRCSNADCGVFWLDPAPPPHELWKAYTTYHPHTRKISGRFGKTMLSLVHRFIRLGLLPVWLLNGLRKEATYLRFMTLADEPVGKLLDVGCGGGRFLKRMQRRGWQVEGTDFVAEAVREVTARYGIKTYAGDLPDCVIEENSFDAITMSQVIEHLYDPKATLQACWRLLKPGGLLVMTTPNVLSLGAAEFGASWRGWEAPRHLHLFSVKTLKRQTEQAGFEVVDAGTYSADAAGVYRVSRDIQKGGALSWWDELKGLCMGYSKELHEYRAQGKQPYTGQNVLIRARKL